TSTIAPVYPLYAAVSLACLDKTINKARICTGITDGKGEVEGGTSVGGGGATTQTATPSRAVLVDRVFRDAALFAGVPGFYWGGAPTNTGAWAASSLFVDRGGGYAELSQVGMAAIAGIAATVLAGTTTGSETVDVDLQPEQMPASYTAGQVSA